MDTIFFDKSKKTATILDPIELTKVTLAGCKCLVSNFHVNSYFQPLKPTEKQNVSQLLSMELGYRISLKT